MQYFLCSPVLCGFHWGETEREKVNLDHILEMFWWPEFEDAPKSFVEDAASCKGL